MTTAPPRPATTPDDHRAGATTPDASPRQAKSIDAARRDDGGGHPAQSFRRAWRWWLPVVLLALALALLFVDPFAGDWDALDYTVLALRGEPSTMLFGRMLFIFTNHFAYRLAHALFGLAPEHAYLLFKYMVVCEAPLVVATFWVLARDLTRDVRAATLAALMLALSPFFVLYSGQAMTEIPSLLLLAGALTVHLRGLRKRSAWLVLAGAALLGLGNNVREVAALYGVWLVVGPFACGWRFGRRELALVALSCALFFVCAFAPFLYFYLGDVGGYRGGWHGWVASMHSEESVHPITVSNFVPLLVFFFIASPLALVALPAAALGEWRARGFTPLLVLACVGVFANLMLFTHYSTVINGRYMLTGLPGVIPLAADFFVRYESRRRRSPARGFRFAAAGVVCTALLFFAAFFPMSWPTVEGHGLTKAYRGRLALLPEDAVVIAGGQTVSVNYYRGIGLGRWDVVGTGGGWPTGRLAEVVGAHLRAGRRVFLDTDPRLWYTDAWRGQETRELVALAGRFRFRRVAENLHEVRPPDDATARDEPDFQRLLEKPPSRLQKLGKFAGGRN